MYDLELGSSVIGTDFNEPALFYRTGQTDENR
jgi:hypothetical protein